MEMNEKLINELTNCKDVNEMSSVLKANGLEISPDELLQKLTASKEELNDDELEQVTGGAGIVNLLGQVVAQYGKEKMGDLLKNIFNNF